MTLDFTVKSLRTIGNRVKFLVSKYEHNFNGKSIWAVEFLTKSKYKIQVLKTNVCTEFN